MNSTAINSYITVSAAKAKEMVADLQRRVAAALFSLPTFSAEEIATVSDGLRKRKDHPDFIKAARIAAAEDIRAQLNSFAERSADMSKFFELAIAEESPVTLSFADYEFLTVDVTLRDFPGSGGEDPVSDPSQLPLPFPKQ